MRREAAALHLDATCDPGGTDLVLGRLRRFGCHLRNAGVRLGERAIDADPAGVEGRSCVRTDAAERLRGPARRALRFRRAGNAARSAGLDRAPWAQQGAMPMMLGRIEWVW